MIADETKRRILATKRDQFLAAAYEAALDIAASAVQTHGVSDEDRARAVQGFEWQRANCEAAAKRLDELLAELP